MKVNIPLLDMIKQVPAYAKFLKNLCTIKRGLNVNKKAFLTEQVSVIIQCKSPVTELPYHLSDDWREFSGENFIGLGGKCEFATILCLQEIGTWLN